MRAEGDLLALLGRHEHEREKETDRERERETEAAVSLRPQDTRLRLPRCMRAYAGCETGVMAAVKIRVESRWLSGYLILTAAPQHLASLPPSNAP